MGNMLTREDARGKLWTYEYDALGRMTATTDPLGTTTRMYYDEVGNIIREVDPEGREKTFEYDQKGNLIKTTDALGNVTLFEYNTDGRVTKQIDPEGKEIRKAYDTNGRLRKTIDGNGNVIKIDYDDTVNLACFACSGGGGMNQPTQITFPTFSREYKYDTRGRKTMEKERLSGSEAYFTYFAYDPSGNLISKTDKEDRTITYEYDDLNRLIKVIDPSGNETYYTYDNRDNLIALTDANGNTTTFEYDGNSRLVKETRPMGEETAYQYDGAGNVVQKIDPKNQKTEYTYDDAGRMMEIRYYTSDDHTTPVKTVVFTYDKVGNLMGYDDGITSATYGYDNAYRKTSEIVNYGPFQKTYSYTYYNNGMKKTFTDPNGTTYTYTYDTNNQLTGIQIPGTGSITYPSYTWNRPASMTLPGGSTKEYTYGPLMRVNSITSKDPGQNPLMNYHYTYDKMDNIVNKSTEHGEYAYGYDDLYRLASADNPIQDNEEFTYDPVGNRLTSADTTGTWTYNDNNELNAYNDTSYEYDDNGNMIQKTVDGQVTNYFYNIENRLLRVEDGNGSVIAEYYYDPFGRRLWKEVDGIRTYFLYSDEGLIGEYDASGVEIKTYGYKPGSTWTTDPLFMKAGNEYYFYQNDHLGTPQKMTGVNGAVVWSAKYSSFGDAEVESSSTITNNLRFPGQYYDKGTGLCYNWKRYYDPKIGRYLTPDPIRPDGGINFFTYANNNPTNFFDNKGLFILAFCTYTSAGEGLGIGILECELHESLCFRGERHTADYYGIFGGITGGSPLGRTSFSLTFKTADDVRTLGGSAEIEVTSASFGGGASWGQICFGAACTYGWSEQKGLDLSGDIFFGYGWVSNIKSECCDY